MPQSEKTELNPYESPDSNLLMDDRYDKPLYSDVGPLKTAGRIGRLRYIAYYFALCLCIIISVFVIQEIMKISELLGGILTLVTVLLFAVFMLSYTWRRLNDINLSGWWMILYLIPVIGNLLALALLVTPGSKRENDYGPPPPPNTLAIKLTGLALPSIVIAAAIALPFYEEYHYRTQGESLQSLFDE